LELSHGQESGLGPSAGHKVGMKREGLLRQHVRKNEGFEDVVLMALLRVKWEKLSPG
jgi:hypothetical protein